MRLQPLTHRFSKQVQCEETQRSGELVWLSRSGINIVVMCKSHCAVSCGLVGPLYSLFIPSQSARKVAREDSDVTDLNEI
jgi:hypothetical protein